MRLGKKTLGLSAGIILGACALARADAYGDLRTKIEGYAGGPAYYYMQVTPFEANRDSDDWVRGNVSTLYKLIGGGYLNAYKPMSRFCQSGMNELRLACHRERSKTFFAFTQKAVPFFGVKQLTEVNVPGLTNARIMIGKVKSYTVKSMQPSTTRGCDIDVVARKELAEKNEVGNLILAGNAFDEQLCFVMAGGAFKLKRFHPIY